MPTNRELQEVLADNPYKRSELIVVTVSLSLVAAGLVCTFVWLIS